MAKKKITEGLKKANALRQKRATDIADWQSALNDAVKPENPRRRKLLAVYERILLDCRLHGMIDQRKLKIKGHPFGLVDTEGKVNEELDALFRQKWFREFLDYTLDALFYGHSLFEFSFEAESIVLDLIPRAHVVPETGEVLQSLDAQSGIQYRDKAFASSVIEVGEKEDLGLLNKAVPMVLYKAFAFALWSEFGELFVMPAKVLYTTTDESKQDQLINSLRELGSATAAIFDKEDRLDYLKNDGANTDVYRNLIADANSELAVLILGQTSTTEEKSYAGSARVHDEVSDDIMQSDKVFVEEVVNNLLLPLLQANGYNTEGYRFAFSMVQNTKEMLGLLEKLLPYYNIDEEWILDKLGVPVTKKQGAFESPELSLNAGGTVKLHANIHNIYNHKH